MVALALFAAGCGGSSGSEEFAQVRAELAQASAELDALKEQIANATVVVTTAVAPTTTASSERRLSDELLVFDPVEKRLLPFPRAIKVRDECVGYFPTLAKQFVGAGEGRFLPFDAIEDLRMATSAIPGHIAVPRWQAGDVDSVESLTRGQGLVQLTGSVLNFGSHGPASIDHLAELVGAVSCSSITWSDPHAAASLLLETMRRQRSQLPS